MCLGAEVEDVRAVARRRLQLADEVVDRRAVGEIGEVHLQAVAEVPDVVQRAARGRAYEGVHGRVELDERVREVRAHEAVGARHEHGAARVCIPEVAKQFVARGACPEGVVRHRPYASASVSKRTESPGLGSLASAALTAVSTLVVTGFAAVVGVVIAHEFGRTEETDGFFAAYGVFIVIVLASQAIRLAVLPPLAIARQEGRLRGEVRGIRDRARRCGAAVPRRGRGRGATRRGPPHGIGLGDRTGRVRRGAAVARAGRDRVPLRGPRGERSGRARRLCDGGSRVRPRGDRRAHRDPHAGRRRRDRGALPRRRVERRHRARRPRARARVARRSGADVTDGASPDRSLAAVPARHLRRPQRRSRSRCSCSTSSVCRSPAASSREPSRASATRTSPPRASSRSPRSRSGSCRRCR